MPEALLLRAQAQVPAATSAAASDGDQAATLRRLFAVPAPRLLPVLMPDQYCATRTSWIAKLAQEFARQGQRTLVVDAARAQVAAALGLRARFDLAQALQGDCRPAAALLDAGADLTLVPAARALAPLLQPVADPAAPRPALAPLLAPLAAAQQARGGVDLLLVLLPFSAARLLPAGEALVALMPAADELAQALRQLAAAAASPAFRLLFPGMGPAAAATLTDRLRCHHAALGPALRCAGALQSGRDLAALARAASGWSLGRLEWTQ